MPVYHLISDENPAHIRHLYPVRRLATFEKDLDFILKYWDPVDVHQVQEHVLGDRPLDRNRVLFSFDDGLREFHDVIAPIFRKKGIPAICFLNSDFIDNRRLFFRYKVSLLIDLLLTNETAIDKSRMFFEEYQLAGHDLASQLRSIQYDKQHLVDELAALVGYDFDHYLQHQSPYLTSAQIKALIDQGFHFGSHSIDHPEYRWISEAEQLRQTQDSTKQVCDAFKLDYRHFAFPFTDYGVKRSFFEAIYKDEMVDLSFGCAGLKKDGFHRHLQRIPLEMDGLSAKEIIHSELVYYLMKRPLGKNSIERHD